MSGSIWSVLIRPGALVVAGLWATAGCATKGDLEALQQEIRASGAQVEALKGETKTGFEATKKQIEERERQLAQDLKAVQEALAKLSEVVKGQQAHIAEGMTRDETLTRESRELRSAVQATNRTLLEFLQTEEARLKEGLRWVQSALKRIAGDDKPKEEAPKEEKPK